MATIYEVILKNGRIYRVATDNRSQEKKLFATLEPSKGTYEEILSIKSFLNGVHSFKGFIGVHEANNKEEADDLALIDKIKATAVYKQIMLDSFDGTTYCISNQGKYETSEILSLWDQVKNKHRTESGMKEMVDFILLKKV